MRNLFEVSDLARYDCYTILRPLVHSQSEETLHVYHGITGALWLLRDLGDKIHHITQISE